MTIGPLTSLTVVELAGIGPAPMAAMLLADLGARVVRVDRPETADLGVEYDHRYDLANRSRPSVAVDLRCPEGIDVLLRMIDRADAVIEPFRPGVAERMGIGPEVCLARNPGLVYGRMTGWGQDGPLALAAGHDINYIALSGALSAIGTKGGPPVPPLNLVGNIGGGALYLAFGICAALLERHHSGRGQIVDAAMFDGSASMLTGTYGFLAAGMWSTERGTNASDSGAHFYNTYETSDGRWLAVAASEERFHDALLHGLGIPLSAIPDRWDRTAWPAHTGLLRRRFREKTLAEWLDIFDRTDACATPVLDLIEAPRHAHAQARGTFLEMDGVVQPAPAPRFSRTPGSIQRPPSAPGADTEATLSEWGFLPEEIAGLAREGVVGRRSR